MYRSLDRNLSWSKLLERRYPTLNDRPGVGVRVIVVPSSIVHASRLPRMRMAACAWYMKKIAGYVGSRSGRYASRLPPFDCACNLLATMTSM